MRIRPDDIETDLRKRLQELGEPLGEDGLRNTWRDQHPQQSTRYVVEPLHGGLRLARRVHDAARPLVEQPALLGERHPPRAAVQEPNAEPLFQPGEPLADRGPRQTQCRRR